MKNLSIFQAPNDGEVTLCEVDGRIHSMNYEYANVSAFTTAIENHPKIHVTRDLLQSHGSGDDARTLFLPVDEPFLKRLVQIYYEQGLIEVLHAASEDGPFLVKKSALLALNLVNGISAIRKKLSSQPYGNAFTIIADISQTRSWLQSPIRCIAWHWYYTKIAVAAADDSVRIYCSGSNHIPLLKCKHQKNITCLAWRPLSNSDLAVGCENGIFLWSIDPYSLVTRPSINNAIMLHRVDHKPIVSLAWSIRGDMLASAAACDSTILVWNVELDETSSLKRRGGAANVLLKWSPLGNRLFSATTGIIFRVWECQTWQAERWSLLSGRIQAACWSPCGAVLLFTTTEEPIIYALSFNQSDALFATSSKNSPNQAMPVYDLSKGDIDGLVIGGIVQSMDWDPRGCHLAVMFQDTNYVAVFKVSIFPVLQLNPSCLVAGNPEEKPTVIEFQKNFEYGACLSIGWSSGRLQHFPIIYSENPTPIKNSNESHADSSFYRSFGGFQSPSTSFHS